MLAELYDCANTFRTGAKKMETPVSANTKMPVILCSLEHGQERGGIQRQQQKVVPWPS